MYTLGRCCQNLYGVRESRLYHHTMSGERGFLTQTDREFLTGEHEYTGENAKQQRYERRQAIAERTRQAFYDFALLYDVLDEHERNRIFDIEPIHDDVDEYNEFREALASTVAFLYRSLEGDIDTDTVRSRSFRVPFERVLTEGLKRGEADRYDREHTTKHRVNVDYGGVELVESSDPATLERGLRKIAERKRHELTEAEMSAILGQYEPDGITDKIDGGGGYERLNERIKELREQPNDTDDVDE